MGLDAQKWDLPAGDIAFEGRGEGGACVNIGIEFKKLDELVASIQSERLQGHQLPKMRGTTEEQGAYDISWLLIEGEILYDRAGRLLQRQKKHTRNDTFKPMPGKMSISTLMKRITVLHIRGGLNPIWSPSRGTTLRWIEALYRTWTDKDLDEHESHIAMYEAPPLIPISEYRRCVRTFPAVGMKASKAFEDAFDGSLTATVMAPVDKLAAIEIVGKKGEIKRFGKQRAQELKEFFK